MPRAGVIQEWRCRTPGAGDIQERRCRTPGAGVIHEDILTDMCGTSARVSGTSGGCSDIYNPVAQWGFHSAWQFEISYIVAAFPRVNNSKRLRSMAQSFL